MQNFWILAQKLQVKPIELRSWQLCGAVTEEPRASQSAVVTSFSGGPAPFCVPGYVTNDVVVAMVISFMERQPERIYEDFAALAPEAVQAAWPCKHSRQR
jgi:hypothetical protein